VAKHIITKGRKYEKEKNFGLSSFRDFVIKLSFLILCLQLIKAMN